MSIRNLPTQISVYDGSGTEKARTSFEYDNYVPDPPNNFHAALLPRSLISGLCDGTAQNCPNGPNFTDPNYQFRGNVTRRTSWILSTSTQVSSYSQYDIAGNVWKEIDPRGYSTTFGFADCFGAPNGEARTNIAPNELASQSQTSYTFATSVTNALGHISFLQFDYYLGRPVDGEDVNGIVASGYYNDPLDRPTKVLSAANQAVDIQSQSIFSYDDVNRTVTTTSDLNSFNDGGLVRKVIYDGLGRTCETRQYEGGTNHIAIKQQYDAMGRPFKTSNPFRPWQNETPVWTTSAFDALSRAISVTTPDSAVVGTAYSGNQVTVTDQIGKARKSVTDALGRLTQVYEDPSGLNYLTNYSYDVLDNLTTVTQGSQTRTFVYDSLKRLTSATNPESGTVSYTYDNNGNLLTRLDARNITTTLAYDALNRVTSKSYNDNPQTPLVSYFYDNQSLPAGAPAFSRGYSTGLLVAVTYGNGSSAGDYYGYDARGRLVLKIQKTGSVNYQVSAAYNASSRVISETYPSVRTVSHAYDVAGRTNNFTGNLGDWVTRTYANVPSPLDYAAHGQLEQEQFGTQPHVYHKLFYNSRLQLSEIRVGTTPTDTSWNRGAIINQYSNQCWGAACNGTDNNGNLKKQEVYVPHNDQVSSYTSWYQQYDYDNLNRLLRVHEYTSNPALDWQQEYVIDRWGNRLINLTNTWGTGIPEPNFSVTTSNNRLTAPAGYTMTYDSAGNLTNDTYSGQGQRNYDAENRMTKAWANGQWQEYTYDGNGRRVRRKVNGNETWQIYGMDGELVAEYDANATTDSAPLKEYGYRNGQMLVAADQVNLALGKTATQSSTHHPTTTASKAVDGNTNGALWDGYASATNSNTNAWWEVDLSSVQSIGAIQVWGRTDCCTDMTTNYYVFVSDNPFTSTNLNTTLNQPGVSNYYVPGYSGTPGTVNANRTGRYVRVQLAGTNYLVLGEVKVLRNTAGINWLVTDQLGTPRMIFDSTGSLGGVKRADYLPFGEELYSGTGVRASSLGYNTNNVRQKFTSKERDNETGLDYFLARYYSSVQGRFTSADSYFGSQSNPQTLNLYTYVQNNPLAFVDPTGHWSMPSISGFLGEDPWSWADDYYNAWLQDHKDVSPPDPPDEQEQQQEGNQLVFIEGAVGTNGTTPWDNITIYDPIPELINSSNAEDRLLGYILKSGFYQFVDSITVYYDKDKKPNFSFGILRDPKSAMEMLSKSKLFKTGDLGGLHNTDTGEKDDKNIFDARSIQGEKGLGPHSLQINIGRTTGIARADIDKENPYQGPIKPSDIRSNHSEKLFVIPDKLFQWEDYRPGPLGLNVLVFDFGLSVAWELSDQWATPRRMPTKPNLNSGSSSFDPKADSKYKFNKERFLEHQLIYLMETKFLRPTLVGSRNGRLGWKKVYIIKASIGRERVDFYLDAKSHLLIRVVFVTRLESGQDHVDIINLSHYRDAAGIQMPHRVSWGSDEDNETRYQINVNYDPKLFERPPSVDMGPEAWKP